MMAYEGSESARDNLGKFIHQFQPETKTLIRKFKRILIKLYRQNVSLLFNGKYMDVCVCVCVYILLKTVDYFLFRIFNKMT